MSSLVSDFIINPVLRQARRFSEISRATSIGEGDSPHHAPTDDHAVTDHNAAAQPLQERSHETTPDSTSPERSFRGGEMEPVTETTGTTPVRDHLGFPISLVRVGKEIPADDGMGTLRGRIHQINAQDISQKDKAKLMHDLLLESHLSSKTVAIPDTTPFTPGHPREKSISSSPGGALDSFKFWQGQAAEATGATSLILSELDLVPTHAPIRRPKSPTAEALESAPPTPPGSQPPLGCQHYERNVKVECSVCRKWYTCVFCHDDKEDHNLVRKDTKHMLCMLCATPQKVSDVCVGCGEPAARYYCSICKLWENRATKPIYHCDDCGICRRGLGLGKDFFHCKTCRACITTSIESSHKCIERSTDCDCPICGDYMFTSPKPVVFMKCGHSIHKKCYDAHMKVSYKCPICSKSLANMESQFRNLDMLVQSQPMPTEFRDTKAVITCNDCSARSTVPYHWLGLKCAICQSYNTAQIQLMGRDCQVPTAQGSDVVSVDAAQAGEPAAATPTQPARPIPLASNHSRSRIGSTVGSRRRHSSHGVELLHTMPDRTARSLSPMPVETATLSRIAAVESEDEEEDNMFGFWGQASDASSDEEGAVDDDDDDDTDAVESDDMDGDGEDEDEDEDDIFLIGHR